MVMVVQDACLWLCIFIMPDFWNCQYCIFQVISKNTKNFTIKNCRNITTKTRMLTAGLNFFLRGWQKSPIHLLRLARESLLCVIGISPKCKNLAKNQQNQHWK